MPHANRKCFLLVHCQTIDVHSSFTVPRLAFLIGFPTTISKPWILYWILVQDLETINKRGTGVTNLVPSSPLFRFPLLGCYSAMGDKMLSQETDEFQLVWYVRQFQVANFLVLPTLTFKKFISFFDHSAMNLIVGWKTLIV